MKKFKIIPACLIVLALLVCAFPVSASAAEDEYGLEKIDILDYAYPNNGTAMRFNATPANNFTGTFTLPFNYAVVFVDVIFEPSSAFTSAGIVGGSGVVESISTRNLDGNLYRMTGQLSRTFGSASLGLQVVASAGHTVVVHRFDIYTYTNQGTGDIGELKVVPGISVTAGQWVQQSAPYSPLFQDFYSYSSPQLTEFDAYISSVNWRKYDYLDFCFNIRAADIQFISAYIGDSQSAGVAIRYLPFDITYVNPNAIDRNEYVSSGSTTVIPPSNDWEIIMRVYISPEMTLDGSLNIHISGNYNGAGYGCLLSSVKGYYYLHTPDPELTKLDQMIAALKETLGSTESQNQAAEEFKDQIFSSGVTINQNNQIISGYGKPVINDVINVINPYDTLDQSGMSLLVSMIQPISHHNYILGILVLSAVLSLVGYLFFGKKG